MFTNSSNPVERLYLVGKLILRASTDGTLAGQREALRTKLIECFAACYRDLPRSIISFSDLKSVLNPIERAGLDFLVLPDEMKRFLAFANGLDIDLNELRIAAERMGSEKTERRKRQRPSMAAKPILPNDARDAWVYEQCCKPDVKYDTIVRRLKERAAEENWKIVSTKQGIQEAARRYAVRHKLPPPPSRKSP